MQKYNHSDIAFNRLRWNVIFYKLFSGVRDTGAAAADPMSGVAVITIEGGNDPHGVFSFAESSLNIHVEEGNTAVQLSVDRKFGAIGTNLVASLYFVYKFIVFGISVVQGVRAYVPFPR